MLNDLIQTRCDGWNRMNLISEENKWYFDYNDVDFEMLNDDDHVE